MQNLFSTRVLVEIGEDEIVLAILIFMIKVRSLFGEINVRNCEIFDMYEENEKQQKTRPKPEERKPQQVIKELALETMFKK